METRGITFRGGLRAGSLNLSWPFAALRLTPADLVIEAAGIRHFLKKDDVARLELYGGLFSKGVRIFHENQGLDQPTIFWAFTPVRICDFSPSLSNITSFMIDKRGGVWQCSSEPETTMAKTAPKNPAVFKLRDTDGIFARHGDHMIGVGFADLDNDKIVAVFERNDKQIEAEAVQRGYPGYWITPDEARALRAREDSLLACKPGQYPWDDWQREALAANVPDELANLGRAVMREACQHSWCEELRDECGAGREEAFKGMILEAREQPDWARSRWSWLLATDGLRVDPWTRNEASPLDLEWTPLRQQWEDENFPLEDSSGDAALRRDAYRFLEEFYELDQLVIISLSDEAFRHDKGHTTYYAEFFIIAAAPDRRSAPRVRHLGVIQNRRDPEVASTFDTVVFKRVEEGDQFE